jgi:hypothetical protein
MQIIFHVGPHKTGTSAIQHFLQRHVDFLRKSGVHVAKPLSLEAGHHEIPWALLDWDLRLIGSEVPGISLDLYLDGVLNDALASGCSTIVFSSEDFSLLDLQNWKDLLAKIESSPLLTESVKYRIISIYRNPDQQVFSQYQTLVRLGLSKKFSEVENELKASFIDIHNRIRSLPEAFENVSEATELDYISSGLMAGFWNSIFPTLEIPEDHLQEVRINGSWDGQVVEVLRRGNLDAGLDFDSNYLLHWPRFHTLVSASTMSRRATRLLAEHESRVTERDALHSERDALLTERDSLLTERDSLLTERDALLTERDSLLSERDALLTERDSLLTERDSLLTERDSLLTERDALVSERELFLNSNSWKITRSLRSLRKLLRG